ncbi:hypothetical protein, conserved in T. vivax [Trypanosoma vivax Y486]|uniref:Uncharacterized protein n=1 Tax=Trypanosoma vivax (strain Y486) TaxID=1055687 RepID=F9WU25_TRYVY|nr:hypothetical protein, conserved in T. vivax [Trypanosoma vivax Y486]|eukprot:CCD21071.1 hypothetical protein, conserved in T. vivax [Trypanosoma vivax Y486]
MRTGLLACVAALVLVSAAKAQGAIIAKTGVKDTDAATLCSVSQTLKQLARQAWREMEEARKRQGRITAACSHATGSEAHLAAAQGATETERLTLIATQLCAHMATATDLTRRASNAAAKLSGHSAALAGEIDQWVSTMSSVVSKAQSGKFCLGSSSAATQGSSTLQGALATALKGKTTPYDAAGQGKTTVPPPTCGTPLYATINEEEEQNLETVKAKLDAEAVTQLLVTTNNIATASSDPASTCPLTSIAQDSNAGIYREHTVAGMWTITGKSSSTLVATYKADKMDTIKALAKELESISTNKGNEAWKTACTLADTSWCTEDVEQARVKIAAIQQEEKERAEHRRRDNEARKAATPKANRNGTQKSQAPNEGQGQPTREGGAHEGSMPEANEKARADKAQLVRTTAAVFFWEAATQRGRPE